MYTKTYKIASDELKLKNNESFIRNTICILIF